MQSVVNAAKSWLREKNHGVSHLLKKVCSTCINYGFIDHIKRDDKYEDYISQESLENRS